MQLSGDGLQQEGAAGARALGQACTREPGRSTEASAAEQREEKGTGGEAWLWPVFLTSEGLWPFLCVRSGSQQG